MDKKPTFKQKWQYFFDNLMAGGAAPMIGMLALFSLVIIIITAVLISLGGRLLTPEGVNSVSFVEAFWISLARTMDAGAMREDRGWGFRFVMFVLPTLGGIFIISSLIGVISSALEGKLGELRKGRSLVLEHNHTVILGWSPQIFTIINEIVEANTDQIKPAIAILAEKDKVEMEDEIRARIPVTKNTHIVCRSGSPIDPDDLELVSPYTARSIVIIPPEEDDPDTFVIKSVLAITNNPNRREQHYNIVTQIREARNMQIINMLGGRDKLNAILIGDLIARVIAQISRQSGLSFVYTELLNFKGFEIYFKEEPALSNHTFADALFVYEDSSVLGLFPARGQVRLNPPMNTLIAPGDKLIVISEDDNTIRLSESVHYPILESAVRASAPVPAPLPEHTLILGWNRFASNILCELDDYVAKDSVATMVADKTFEKQIKSCPNVERQKINFIAGDTTDRTLLDDLLATKYDHVIVLADTTLPIQAADARTLVTLLHLRDISSRNKAAFTVVSEMLDLRNRELAKVTNVDDFIVSGHLVSLIMVQLSENSDFMPVLTDLFDPETSEIYLKPAEQYVSLGEPVNFYTVIEAASRRGETAFGYRIIAEHNDAEKSYGIHTNPKKTGSISFKVGDKIIVLAE